MRVPRTPTDILRPNAELLEIAAGFARAARAPRTIRAYAKQWEGFCRFCASRDLTPLPAASDTVCLWLAARALDDGVKVSTLALGLAAIDAAHRAYGHGLVRASATITALTALPSQMYVPSLRLRRFGAPRGASSSRAAALAASSRDSRSERERSIGSCGRSSTARLAATKAV